MKNKTVLSLIQKTELRRMFLPGIVFALLLSLFFLLNVPALFYPGDSVFIMQFLRLIVLLLLVGQFIYLLYNGLVAAFPTLSPAVRKLSHYGSAQTLLAEAEEEMNGKHILDQDNTVLTPKYLFKFAGHHSAIVPLESALWAFTLNNMRYSFTYRRERMVYFLRVVTIAGDTYKFSSLYKKNIDKITDTLSERYPNFFYGYSEEHEKMVRYILNENTAEQKAGKKG